MRWFVFLLIAIALTGVVSAQETTAEPATPTLETPPTLDLTTVPLPTAAPTLTPTPEVRKWVLDESGAAIGAVDFVMQADTSFSIVVQLVQTLILFVWFLLWLGRERE